MRPHSTRYLLHSWLREDKSEIIFRTIGPEEKHNYKREKDSRLLSEEVVSLEATEEAEEREKKLRDNSKDLPNLQRNLLKK